MKSKLLIIIALLISATANSQTVDSHTSNYAVRYEKAHLLLEKSHNLNVLDYNIEWPEIVDFSEATALKRAITKYICNTTAADLDSALSAFNAQYGSPVSKPFDTIPDDRQFCYITASARIAGYKQGQWIAYHLEIKVEPQALSPYRPQNESRVIVYDINNDRVFLADDLLNPKVAALEMPQDFYDKLFSPLSDDFFNNMKACEINGVWLQDDKLNFLVTASTPENRATYTANLELADFDYALSRSGRRLFTKKNQVKTKPQPIFLSQTWHGDSIYNNVEKMPTFKGGEAGLREYLSHVVRPDAHFSTAKRVYICFIVDKNGNTQDITVLSPVSPEIDRHAASVIKGMPQFVPGEQGGQKVCVRLFMPINYKP